MTDAFSHEFETARQQLETLRQQTGLLPEQQSPYDRAPTGLSGTLQRIQEAYAELSSQNEECVSACRSLEAERAYYRDVFEHAPHARLLTDVEGNIQVANVSAYRLLQAPPGALVGRPVTAYLPEEDREAVRLWIAELRAGHEVREWQVRLQASAGDTVPAELDGVPIHDVDGELAGLQWCLRDITQQARTEEALRESESTYRLLVENLHDGIWRIDKDGYTTFVNPRMAEMLGYSVDEMLGAHVLSFVEEQDLAEAQARLVRSRQGIRETVDFQLRRKDGSLLYGNLETTPMVDAQGAYAGALAGVADITDRKRAEEERKRLLSQTVQDQQHIDSLRAQAQRQADEVTAAFNSMAQPLIVWDAQGIGVRANPAAIAAFGLDPTGMQITDVARRLEFRYADGRPIPTDDIPVVRSLRGETVRERHELFRNTAGEERHRMLTTAPIVSGGLVAGVAASWRDVTEQERIETELRQSEEFNRSIIQSSRDCIKLLDLDGRLQFMSEGGQELLRVLDIGRYLNMPYETFWQGSDSQAALDAIATARSGEIGRFEGYCPTEEGTPKWWDVVVSPVWGASGQIERLLAVSRDVTDRKNAAQALAESEAKLRTLFENLPIGVSILDHERRIVMQNTALERILGLSRERLRRGHHEGRTYLRFDRTPMPPDEYPSARAIREQRPVHDQVGIVKEDGEEIWVDVSAAPVPFADWQVVTATVDITERKRSEEALRHARNGLEARVEERTAELVRANELLHAEILERSHVEDELRRSEQVLEQRVEERTRELSSLLEISNRVALTLDLEPLLDSILDHLKGVVDYDGATVFRLEDDTLTVVAHRGPSPLPTPGPIRFAVDHTPIVRRVMSGQHPVIVADVRGVVLVPPTFFETTGRSLEPAPGPIRSWMGVPLAIKERPIGLLSLGHGEPNHFTPRQAELALAIANQMAVAIENTRLYEQAQELAAMEERQHLARELHDAVSQTLFSASLAADVLPRLWERDHEAGLRCLSEVRQLTRGALAEMRMLLLELRPAALMETELGALLNQLAEATTNRARIQVTVRAAPQCPLPPEVQVTLYRMAQEALNNVAKHAVAQHADIELRCTLPVPSGEGGRPVTMVELCVVDDGCGFDAARLPAGSRGLGLHIMRERAQAVGASLRIESRPGQGTRVTVRWPEED